MSFFRECAFMEQDIWDKTFHIPIAGKIIGISLDFPFFQAYNVSIPGMTENTFLLQRLQESMRLVRAYEPRKEYRLPTGDGSRPIPRGIKGSAERRQQGWNRGRRKAFHARPFISHDGTGVFICPPNNRSSGCDEGGEYRVQSTEFRLLCFEIIHACQ